MATSTPQCGICDHRKQNTPAKVWCHECNEGLCESCHDFHGSVKTSRDHKTILISEYLELPSSLKEINEFCNVHNEKFITYCKDHNVPCCRKCLVETHGKCTFVELEVVIENAKSSSCFQELEETLTELVSNFGKIKKNREANKARIATQKEEIATKIRELRQNINKHLDNLEKDILSKLSTIEINEYSKIDSEIKEISDKERILSQKQSTKENVKQHASNLQAFLFTKQEENDVTQIQAQMSATENEDNICETDLSFTVDSGIERIMSDITAFGKVNVQMSPLTLGLYKRKEKQAQNLLPVIKRKDFSTIDLKLKQRYDCSGTEVFGLTTMQDGGIIYTQRNRKLLICMNRDGSLRFKFDTNFNPFDVEIVDDTTVAISSGENAPNIIFLFDVTTQSKIKTIKLKNYVYGIAMKDKLIFCAIHVGPYKGTGGIYRLNSHDAMDKINQSNSTWYNNYLTISNDNILYTTPKNHTVTCCDIDGSTKWVFKDDTVLVYPMGIVTDDKDLVYVAGNISNNVVVLTTDGKSCRQILSKDDGLNSPTAIHFDTTRNEMLVANISETIFKFSFL